MRTSILSVALLAVVVFGCDQTKPAPVDAPLEPADTSNDQTPPLEAAPEIGEEILAKLNDWGGRTTYDADDRLTGLDLLGTRATLTDDDVATLAAIATLRDVRVRGSGITDKGLAELAKLDDLDRVSLMDASVTDEGVAKLCAAQPTLRVLELRKCGQVGDAGVEAIANLADLEHLALLGTGITDDGLARLADIQGLRAVDIRACVGVSAKALESLAALPSLEALQIGGCTVDDDAVRAIAKIKNLKDVRIEDCSVTPDGLAALADVPLERLHLFRCWSLNDEAVGRLLPSSTLRSLTLSDMPINGEVLVPLQDCPRLVALDLRQTMINDATSAALADLTPLQSLSLAETFVTNETIPHVAKLSNLETANLTRLGLADEDLEPLRGHEKLRSVTLSGDDGITPAAVEIFKTWPSLQMLDLSATNCTEADIDQLRKKLPNCEIRYTESVAW